MVKKAACALLALAVSAGILFLVHAQVDAHHGAESGAHGAVQEEAAGGH